MTTSKIYIGIDVAKATIDVGSTERLLLRKVPNTDAGHRQVIEHLQGQPVGMIVIESTGIYAAALVRALILAGLPVAVVQPGRARHFAKSQNIRAKTDAIDAVMLARFGEATKPRLHALPAENIERLRALCNRRDQVIEDRVREQNRLEACQDVDIGKQIKKNITRLEKEEAGLDKKIAKAIDEDSALKTQSDLMQQIPGVGVQTIAILLAHLPELGAVNRQQISALAGVAPYDNASGTHEGARHIYGGRERVRQALYMATLAACRFDHQIAEFYQRLKKNAKKEKVARIACARKLLIKLNTILAQAARPTEPKAAVA
jgi:transposase